MYQGLRHQEKRLFGAGKVRTPLLGFGAAPIGNLYRAVPEVAAQEAVDRAIEMGLMYFDTAPHYGFGLSESRLGRVVGGRQETLVLSTKVGRLLKPLGHKGGASLRHGFADTPDLEPVFDYSYEGVMRSFEASLARLGCDGVDILWAHDLGALTHGNEHPQRWREFMDGGYRAMDELRAQGVVGAIGLGANEWQVCAEALACGDFDGFLLAGRYTLLEQTAGETLFPLCERRGVSVIVGGPFNSGILATGVKGPGPHYYNYQPADRMVLERVARIEAVCDQFEVPMAAAALQLPAAHPQVSSVLAGMADAGQVERAVELFNRQLPAEFWTALVEERILSPGVPVPRDEAFGRNT